MRRPNTLRLLLFLAILLLLLVGHETYRFYAQISHLDFPTQETRQPLGRHAHGWMNAAELARLYKVPVAEVFAALNIQPASGDEKLALKDLAQKYDKTPDEIETALNQLNNQFPGQGEQ